MGEFAARLRDWWGGRRERHAAVPFQVACGCGQVVEGLRQPEHQVATCPGCRGRVFVLPTSPLPAPDSVAELPSRSGLIPDEEYRRLRREPAPPEPAPPPARPWLLPLLAALVTLAAVVGAYVWVFQYLARHPVTKPAVDAEGIEARAEEGREAIAVRDYPAAVAALEDARRLVRQYPDILSASRRRRIEHLGQQAELLAVRLPKPLDQLLRGWAGLEPEDLQTVLAGYRGKAVFFDLDVLRDGAGEYEYSRRLGAELPQLDLAGLKLLQRLPLQNTRQRLLFGARLASVTRVGQGDWVIAFVPDSGVLITDSKVATVCVPVVDDDVLATLRRQEEWTAQLP